MKSDYINALYNTVDKLFDEAAKENRPKDWKKCQRLVGRLVVQECGKSFRNGIRFATNRK